MSGIGAIALPAVGVGAAIGGGYVAYKQYKKWVLLFIYIY